MSRKEGIELTHKTICDNVIKETKKRIFSIESEIVKMQFIVSDLMEKRDKDQKYIINILENGISAIK